MFGASIGKSFFSDFDFADDVAFLSELYDVLQLVLTIFEEEVASSFRMLAQSYTPNIYTPTPIPFLYNPFTIVLHKRLSACLFRAEHTPACWIGTKQNKDFHPATPQPIENQDYWPNPSRMWI